MKKCLSVLAVALAVVATVTVAADPRIG